MRYATAHDLLITGSTLAGFIVATIFLQIVIITKSTIPASDVITEIRIHRNEATKQNSTTNQRLADIEALLGNKIVKQEVLQQMSQPDGISPNTNR